METAQQIKGKWQGHYAYDSLVLPELTGHAQTFFTIEINNIESSRFSGTVQDDVSTGGMKEEGKIEGELNGSLVNFKKLMPVQSTWAADGKMESADRKHPVIYYKGEYFPIEKKMRGVWKIKGRMFFYQRKLYITRKSTGTWEMSFTQSS